MAFAALLLAWGGAYLAVRHAAHLSLPHRLEQDPTLLGTPIPARFASALAATGHLDEALARVDHLLRIDPGQQSARVLRERIVANQTAIRSP